MNEPACDHVDQRGAWVLGALPEQEAGGFESHLSACTACRREVAVMQSASDALVTMLPSVPVPPSVEAELMTVVRGEARLLQAASSPAPDHQRAGSGARLRRTPARLAAALVAGAVLLGAGVAIGTALDDGSPGGPPAAERLVVRSSDARATLRLRRAAELRRARRTGPRPRLPGLAPAAWAPAGVDEPPVLGERRRAGGRRPSAPARRRADRRDRRTAHRKRLADPPAGRNRRLAKRRAVLLTAPARGTTRRSRRRRSPAERQRAQVR